jgi:hypothetical protein
MNLIETIVSLAKEIESEDPIDFGMLDIDEELAYHLIANKFIEVYLSNDKDDRDTILLATAVKLAVENFALQREKILKGNI